MKRQAKKNLIMLVHSVAVIAIVFALTFTAVFAWFYKDLEQEIILDPTDFVVSINVDGSVDQNLTFTYTFPAATVYTTPGDTTLAAGYADRMFNACVKRTTITISNTGDTPVKARFTVEMDPTNPAVCTNKTGTAVTRNPLAGNNYALKYAVVNKTAAEMDAVAAGNLDAYGFPKYKETIAQQITAGSYTDIGDMNEKILKDLLIYPQADPEDTTKQKSLLMVYWVDYFDMLTEFGFAPNTELMQCKYTIKLTVKAVSPGAP